jgi:hypothetical protein
MREEFTKKVKDTLAKRVNFLCSNPKCRRLTVGPNNNESKSTLVGVAAHIYAASLNGPRYNNELSNLERSSINNGIWLCCNCSVMIDKDEAYFTTELIKGWKEETEKFVKISLCTSERSVNDKLMEIKSSLSKLISNNSISDQLADLFFIALKYNIENLKEITTREINGYYAIDLPELIQIDKLEYRIATVVVTPQNLNLKAVGHIPPSEVLQEIIKSKNGFSYKYLFHAPLRELESLIQEVSNEEKLIYQIIDSGFLKSNDGNELNTATKLWFKSSDITGIITNVRNQLTRILTSEILNDHT